MSLCPFARVRLMPYASSLPKRQDSPTLILHTNGGGTDHGSLYGWFSRPGNDICSHFQVMTDGTIEQYVPVDREAYAEYAGNTFAVSVETEDDGHPEHRWSDAQVRSIVKLARWLDVPAKVSPDGKGGGVGWHSLYADWNESHHNCPGTVRVAQVHDQVLPDLARSTGGHPGKRHPHPSRPVKHKPLPYPFRDKSRVLKVGSIGPAVRAVQKALNDHGAQPTLRDDGDFGPVTRAAVRRFQRQHPPLTVDGVVGPHTWAELFR